jgi:hypothetical protein
MKKVFTALAFLFVVVLVPSPAFADEVKEASSVNMPLVVAGGVIAAGGILLWLLKKGGQWVAPAAVAAGVIVLALGFLIRPGAGGEASSEAVVSIVEPSNGERVDAGKPVTVRVALQNGSIAMSPTDEIGGHLHLYLDDKLQQMPYSMEAKIELPAGAHQLRVEFVDHRHVSFDPPVDTTITLTAE